MSDDEPEGGVELDIGAAIFATLGDISSELATARRHREEQSENDITDQTQGWGGAEVPSGGVLVQPITPQVVLGRGIEVRSIVVGGNLVTDTPAGAFYILRSAMPGVLAGASTPPILNLVDMTHAALPQVAFYSSGQLVLRRNEQLWGVLIGGTQYQNISGNFAFKQIPESIGVRGVVEL